MTKGTSQLLQPTTGAVDWEIWDVQTVHFDKFDADRISLFFGAAPSSAGLVTLSINSGEGSDFDGVLRSIDPVGKTSISFEDVKDIDPGSKLLIEYANPDGVSVSGEATLIRYEFKND